MDRSINGTLRAISPLDLRLSQSPARSTMGDGTIKRNWKVNKSLDIKLFKHYDKLLKNNRVTYLNTNNKSNNLKLGYSY